MNRPVFNTRAVFLVMASLAMMLKLLLAPGLMPSMDARGEATLVICTSAGSKVIADPFSDAGEQKKPPCPFESQSAAATVTPPQPVRLAAIDYPVASSPVETGAAPGRGLTAPPPPSTGPPLLLA